MKSGCFLINRIVACSITIVIFSCVAHAQKDSLVKKLMDEQRYVFQVESVTPMSGRMRQLTPGYDLRISTDTIASALPYFGRGFTAPLDPSDAGINFTSTKFEYSSSDRKKGGWDITIKPKDNRTVDRMILTVFENGRASLNVTCIDRQPISYAGYIEKPKKKK